VHSRIEWRSEEIYKYFYAKGNRRRQSPRFRDTSDNDIDINYAIEENNPTINRLVQEDEGA
jgi:hypothetical protein